MPDIAKVPAFFFDVIELENDQIGFAAVHARMRSKVLKDELSVSPAVTLRILIATSIVLRKVTPIVRATVSSTTLLAVRRRLTISPDIEVFSRKEYTTHRTSFERLIGHVARLTIPCAIRLAVSVRRCCK